MRSRSILQLGLLTALASGLVGFRTVDMSTSTSNTPLVRKVESKTRTNATKCNFYALGWIPTGAPVTLDGFLRQMTAGSDGLVDVSVESSNMNFGVVSWQCWRVAGTPFKWGRALVAAPAAVDGAEAPAAPAAGTTEGVEAGTEAAAEAPAAPAAAPPIAAAILPPPPPQAAPLTERLLKQIGAKVPEDEDAFRKLCTEVWNLRQKNNLKDRDMVQVARVGQGKVAPGSDLMTVLEAGLGN